jgi:hypothetical protein
MLIFSSKITFNKGGEWDLIQPPEFSANGQPSNCHIVSWCCSEIALNI